MSLSRKLVCLALFWFFLFSIFLVIKKLPEFPSENRNESQFERYKRMDYEGIIHNIQDVMAAPRKNVTNQYKIAIVTMFDTVNRYQPIVSVSIENKQAFANFHGYDLFIDNDVYYEPDAKKRRPFAWGKLIAMKKRLLHYDWVMWLDVDTLIMNMSIPIQHFIDDNFDFIVTKDGDGLNSGVFLMKSSNWSMDFLDRCWAHEEIAFGDLSIYEQRAIKKVIEEIGKEEEVRHIKYLPQKAMNCYTKYHFPYRKFTPWENGDFLVHFAGCRYHPSCASHFTNHFKQMFSLSVSLNPSAYVKT